MARLRRVRRAGVPWSDQAGASVLVYLSVGFLVFLEQFGLTTNDTKPVLIEAPGRFLRDALQIWDGSHNFGELQNQAYGYLFPQGPFFLLTEAAHVPPWVAERLWTVLLVVVGCEGARLVGRSVGLAPWAAWVAGLAYGLNPRVIGELTTRSAEVLPTVVLPWVVLPVVLAITGRLSARRAALLSAAASLFGGAANATATLAVLPVVLILILWAIRSRRASWGLLGWWVLLMAVANAWWISALLITMPFTPDFYNFVEDAPLTTRTAGANAALRGMSNWVAYTFAGGDPTWPAGAMLAFEPALVLATGLLAALGAYGMATFRSPWRTPLAISGAVGFVLVTIAHVDSFLTSPLAPSLVTLLDGPLAFLRNVSKADASLRLPLALGVGMVLGQVLQRAPAGSGRRARARRPVTVAAVVLLALSPLTPVLAHDTRTPGWDRIPEFWSQTADFLAKEPGDDRAWVIPGSGFALQSWGWTADEPFGLVSTTPWVSRSQVTLTPPETIRVLAGLEGYLETGTGSPRLGATLGRLGIGHIVVRHDIDASVSDGIEANLVSIALARSRGVTRVAQFGSTGFGPAVEIYRTDTATAPEVQVLPLADVITVASAAADVLRAVGEGVIAPRRPALVQGDLGWDRPADVLGDTYRDRARNFGRVHDAEGPVLAEGEATHSTRKFKDYPANEQSKPVRAVYEDRTEVTASSSQAWIGSLGAIEPETAPYSAVDGDDESGWRSALYQDAREQWLEIRRREPEAPGVVRIRTPVGDSRYAAVSRWRVTVGGQSQLAVVNPFSGVAEVDMGAARGKTWRIAVERVEGDGTAPVEILEVSAERGLPVRRVLRVPPVRTAPDASLLLTAQPETRSCIATLLGPDCSTARGRGAEESAGISRVVTLSSAGQRVLEGTVVARAQPSTARLLDPIPSRVAISASSFLYDDPSVSARMAWDGVPATSWIADPRDRDPRLEITFDRPRTIRQLVVTAPSEPAVRPTQATITAGRQKRVVALGRFGTFDPVRARKLTIEFQGPQGVDDPVGVGELSLLPGDIAAPLAGATATGAVCGLGPNVTVNGVTYPTEVRGRLGDVVSAGPLTIRSCSGPIVVREGENQIDVTSSQEFQPVAVRLSPPEESATVAETSPARTVAVSEREATRLVLRVGAGAESLLATTWNFNSGWVAELDGRRLDALQPDGWAQGWRIPAGAGGRLTITFSPERPYRVALLVGLGFAGVVLLGALVALRPRRGARRRHPGIARQPAATTSPASAASVSPTGRPRRWALLVASPVTWALGGVPALGALWLVARVRRSASVRRAGAGLIAAGSLVAAWQLRDGPQLDFGLADVLTGLGFFVLVLSAWNSE